MSESTELSSAESSRDTLRRAHRLSMALLASTFLLLIAGAQVTSTESGDAVDSWPAPLHVPAAIDHAFWELFHRAVAGVVAVTSLVLALSLHRAGARVPGIRARGLVKLGWAAGVLVLAQAGLGGIRVLVGASDPTSSTPDESLLIRAIGIVHACVAQAFLLLVVTIAVFSRPSSRSETSEALPSIRRLACAMTALTYVQVVLGAVLRHTMTDLSLLVHVAGALCIIVVGTVLAGRILGSASTEGLRRSALGIGVGLALQIVFGVISYILVNESARTAAISARAIIPSLHLAIGGAILAFSHAIYLRVRGAEWPSAMATSAPLALEGGLR